MNETYMKKIPFLKLLNLEAITPENDSSAIFRNHLLVSPCYNADLAYKNNSIQTGYENFCIKKGTLNLFPFKDFDFAGKHVVCLKCCQKFASKFSYKAHVNTDICVKTYNGPNLIYLKYKNRNYKQFWKKKKKKILNPEILNTLKTRSKVYSDIIHQQNKDTEKPMKYSDNNNFSVIRPRGRPKKNIIGNNFEKKKRSRPKKLNAMTPNSSNQSNSSSSSNLKIYESKEPKNFINCSFDNTYNNNIKADENLQLLSSKMKYLTAKFWKLFKKECESKGVDINKYQYPTKHQGQYNEEKKVDLYFLKIGELEYDFKFLFEQFHGKKEYPYNDELKLMLTRISEIRDTIKQSSLNKTDMNGSIPVEGKDNIQCTLKQHENETEIEMNNIDLDKNEKYTGIWINNASTVSYTITIKNTDSCKSVNQINVDNFENIKSIRQDNFKENLKTTDRVPNVINSVKNNLNDHGLNCINNPKLICRICIKKFTSIAELKLHQSEHLAKFNKKILCTVCGLKFEIYKNYKKHVNKHKKTKQEQLSYNQKNIKKFVCKICNKQYNYLRSYFSHIKTHIFE